MPSIKETLPFNFNDIYSEIKTNFSAAGYDIAEGSNSSQLLTSMAYLVSNLNANTALNVNETILAYATEKDNVINDARNFGYEIHHRTSYSYDLIFRLSGGSYVIPKYSAFTIGDKIYYYLGKQIEMDDVSPGTEITIRVKEGILHTYQDDPESLDVVIGEFVENDVAQPQYYIDIPYMNVEENGIEVFCTYIDDYNIVHDHEEWTRASDSFVETDTQIKTEYIRVDNIEYKTPRIYFKYAGIGNGLKLGTEVMINVLVSSGSQGKASSTAPSAVKHNIADAECIKISLVSNGSDEEDTERIRTNAPKAYNSANRLVTGTDYAAACMRDGRITNCRVWGGEDEFPLAPGHIWFSFLPVFEREFSSNDTKTNFLRNYSSFEYDYAQTAASQAEAAEEFYNHNFLKNTNIQSADYSSTGILLNPGIWDNLRKLRIPTLEFHHRHPIYLEFDYDFSILKYTISDAKASVHQEIFNIIDNAFIGNDAVKYEDFDAEYFNASLIKRIDKRVTDISGFTDKLETHLLLTRNNCSSENEVPEYKDIYIPLAASYEKYFDDSGYLIIDNLPNIDTKGFVKYLDEPGGDLVVDWTKIKKDIETSKKGGKKILQSRQNVIIAPVYIEHSEVFKASTMPGTKRIPVHFPIYPDDLNESDSTKFKFNNTKLLLNGKTELKYANDSGWFYDKERPNSILLGSLVTLNNTDTITISTKSFCGFYFLFNSRKKEVLVHLFVDGTVSGLDFAVANDVNKVPEDLSTGKYLYSYDDNYLYSTNEYYPVVEGKLTPDDSYIENVYSTPRSYLNSRDSMYLYTPDSYYLTTNGYAVTSESDVNQASGKVIKEINSNMYLYSGLKYDLFNRSRRLNLKYPSPNFKVIRNVIPVLRSVKFSNKI